MSEFVPHNHGDSKLFFCPEMKGYRSFKKSKSKNADRRSQAIPPKTEGSILWDAVKLLAMYLLQFYLFVFKSIVKGCVFLYQRNKVLSLILYFLFAMGLISWCITNGMQRRLCGGCGCSQQLSSV